MGETNINEQDIQYINIITQQKFLSNKYKIVVDFGQGFKWTAPQQVIKGPDGKAKTFGSVVAALNFFYKNGWEFVDQNTYINGQQTVGNYLLQKKTAP